VDLHPIDRSESRAEQTAVDGVLGPATAEPPLTAEVTRGRRHLLLPSLLALQSRVGWVSAGGLGYVCRRLGVPPAEAYGVASFYALLALSERPSTFLHLCDDIACQLAGAERLCAGLEAAVGKSASETHHRADGAPANPVATTARWARSPCLGLCEHAPAALLTVAGEQPFERGFGRASVETLVSALEQREVAAPAPSRRTPGTRLLARVGVVNPESLDDYRAHRGYEGLRRALALGPEGIIREVTDAKLLGRGGAAFPTGRKWEAVARSAARPHHLICNADESEPGTFKDRVLLEEDPFALVEAMTIAGIATGAEHGYFYVRGEYPLAAARLNNAIRLARTRGFLGERVMGSTLHFDLEVRRGGGAYICGEETALLNSIEGLRGEPRNKPPFPAQLGLFGKPTAINNVETLVAALEIVRDGAANWSKVGTFDSVGTKLFCLCGNVERPGVYEVPFGTPLDALISLAGGVPGGRAIKAVLLGGAAGTFVTGDDLKVPLTFEDTRKIGATLGSGVVLVLDDRAPLMPLLRRVAAFFRDESCGQCVPCRVGTVRQEELIARLARGAPLSSMEDELKLLNELGQAMRDASICGLGQTASSAIESALKRFSLKELR
jgi:NADH-quinone oxidoreductase subunit F